VSTAKNACPRCRAENAPQAPRCWLCGIALPASVGRPPALSDRAPALIEDVEIVPEARATFSLTTLFLLTTLIAVCFGLFAIAPGLGILLAIAAVPAFLRTTLVAYRRGQLGRDISPARKIALFAGSLATTVIMAIVVIVAAIGSFCAICLTAGVDTAIPIATIIALATTVGVGGLFVLLIRARYRHDVSKD
jgi:hypothetical protein